jgi:hypothetical protein
MIDICGIYTGNMGTEMDTTSVTDGYLREALITLCLSLPDTIYIVRILT